jgi:hypothetical protein
MKIYIIESYKDLIHTKYDNINNSNNNNSNNNSDNKVIHCFKNEPLCD